MKRKVLEYLNLNEMALQREDGVIIFDDNKMDCISTSFPNKILTIDDAKFYYKRFAKHHSAYEKGVSKFYNQKELGLNSPQAYILKYDDEIKGEVYYTITQDVKEIFPNNIVETPDSLGFKAYLKHKKDKFEFLHNKNTRHQLLQFFTKEALDKLTLLMILDECRAENDRKPANYIVVKSMQNNKIVDIVPIDSEFCEAIEKNVRTREDFERFRKESYYTENALGFYDMESYDNRINYVSSLIQKGYINEKILSKLRFALAQDFPELLREACNSDYMSRQYTDQIYDANAYIWEFVNNTIGREL